MNRDCVIRSCLSEGSDFNTINSMLGEYDYSVIKWDEYLEFKEWFKGTH
jgi:hypothetical protein